VARVLAAVTLWLALSAFAGLGLAALGAGTLALPWVIGSSAFASVFFSPLLALATDG
jgi:hypothetical protein